MQSPNKHFSLINLRKPNPYLLERLEQLLVIVFLKPAISNPHRHETHTHPSANPATSLMSCAHCVVEFGYEGDETAIRRPDY